MIEYCAFCIVKCNNPYCDLIPNPENKMSGTKHDKEKPAIALIPRAALDATGYAFGYGAKKYGKWNYQGGIEITRLLSATHRHMAAFLDGEDLDPESGHHHLGHAIAGLAIALDTLQRNPKMDDRSTDE